MFIIIESGSTKADWVIVHGRDQYTFFTTDGINPATQKELLDLQNYPELLASVLRSDAIYFYGAGINDALSTQRITYWLQSYGYNSKLKVEEDLLAAAKACFGDEPGIVCILGTGSNSCVYDGSKIVDSVQTLGYFFSDEGGGTQIGKEVLKAYFYNNLPIAERDIFEANYPITKEEVVENVYRKSGGNKYVASFAPFLMMINGSWKENLLDRVFKEFIELRILRYTEHSQYKIRFVGSIAFYHREYLEKAMQTYGLEIDEIVQKPVHKLIDYHLNH
ncbi:MAG: hypothetical protein IPM42_00625 [Saprospiraceae bacterium]|nr:hypothetical protein [Saprospiraceae bacterium]